MWYKASVSHSGLTLPNDERKPHTGKAMITGSLEMLIKRKVLGYSSNLKLFA